MLAVQTIPISGHGRQAFEALRLQCHSSKSNRKANSTMPNLEQLRKHGLQLGDRARSRDTDCSICQERVQDPVVTECQHIYCYECIQQWLRRSAQCPDCRRGLQEERARPRTATTSPDPNTAARYSSMHWVKGAVDESFAVRSPSVLSLATSQSTPSLRSEASLDHRISQSSTQPSIAESDSLSSPQEPPSASPSASWCLQRRMPLRNRAAHPPRLYSAPNNNLSSESLCSARTRRKVLYNTPKHLPPIYIPQQPTVQPILHPTPQRPTIQAKPSSGSLQIDPTNPSSSRKQLITVDAEDMLSKMWHTSAHITESMQITIRCRAITKCAWREWRELLEANDGRDLYAEDLLKALSRTFERMVVEYGWVEDWRLLPEPFIQMMKKTAKAAMEVG